MSIPGSSAIPVGSTVLCDPFDSAEESLASVQDAVHKQPPFELSQLDEDSDLYKFLQSHGNFHRFTLPTVSCCGEQVGPYDCLITSSKINSGKQSPALDTEKPLRTVFHGDKEECVRKMFRQAQASGEEHVTWTKVCIRSTIKESLDKCWNCRQVSFRRDPKDWKWKYNTASFSQDLPTEGVDSYTSSLTDKRAWPLTKQNFPSGNYLNEFQDTLTHCGNVVTCTADPCTSAFANNPSHENYYAKKLAAQVEQTDKEDRERRESGKKKKRWRKRVYPDTPVKVNFIESSRKGTHFVPNLSADVEAELPRYNVWLQSQPKLEPGGRQIDIRR